MTQMMKSTKIYAAKIPQYQTLDITVLAEGYCDAKDNGDDFMKQCYMAALLLRFWYVLKQEYIKSFAIGLYEFDDMYERLYNAIDNACNYRAWRDPEKKLNAQQCIRQSIGTRMSNEDHYFSNLDKHKANVNAISLDAPLDTDVTDSDSRLDLLEGGVVDKGSVAKMAVQYFIDNQKIIEAIVIDTIAFNDTIKKETSNRLVKDIDTDEDFKIQETEVSFWRYKAAQYLATLPKNYSKYFSSTYNINMNELTAAIDKVRKSNNQKLYKYIDTTLAENKKALLSILL